MLNSLGAMSHRLSALTRHDDTIFFKFYIFYKPVELSLNGWMEKGTFIIIVLISWSVCVPPPGQHEFCKGGYPGAHRLGIFLVDFKRAHISIP